MGKRIEMRERVSTEEKVIAITFDDGPDPLFTPQLLDIFNENEAKATFFVVGEQLEKNRDVAVKAALQGHELGNHTFTHPYLSQAESAQQLFEFKRTEDLIQEITGRKPVCFRPPYFDSDERVEALCADFEYEMVGALNMDSEDWRQPGVQHIIDTSRNSVKPGAILIYHDGMGDRSQTVEAIRTLVPELKAAGYRIVTVSELLALEA